MKIHWIGRLALRALLASGFATVVLPGPAGPQGTRLEVPFDLYREYIIVARGSIGGRPDKNFLIDTGAAPSVLDARMAKKLKLAGRQARLSLFAEEITVDSVALPSLELGPIRVTDHPAVVRDLRFIERAIGVRIDAIVGLDVLGWSNLTIDYRTRTLRFGVQEFDGPGIPFDLGPGCMLLSVRVEGRTLRLMIDTGVSGLMLFEDRFRTMFPDLKPKGRKEFENMAGARTLTEVELPRLEIGGNLLGSTTAALIPSTSDTTPAFDGLLGPRILGVQRLSFDFNGLKMSWVGQNGSNLSAER